MKADPRPTTVRRSKKTRCSRFVRIDNAAIQNADLSYRARGVLAYVLSMPDDWRHSADSLAHASPEGVHAARAALRELAETGHATLEKVRDHEGRVFHRWVFCEAPSIEKPDTEAAPPSTDLPNTVKPQCGKPEGGLPSDGKTALFITTGFETTGAAASAAAAPVTESFEIDDVNGIAAFPPPVGGAAALPDGKWLPPQLTLLDLRRVQLAVHDLAELELFQIADIYHAFQLRKRRFVGDVRKARKQRPDLQPWQWFAEEVQNFDDWKRVIEAKRAGNVMHRGYHVIDANKRQPTDCHESDWQRLIAEAAKGAPIDPNDVFYPADHPAVPKSWDQVAPWMRAIVCGTYRPGRLVALKRKAAA